MRTTLTEEARPHPIEVPEQAPRPRDRRQRPRALLGRLRQLVRMHTSHPLTELLDAEVGGGAEFRLVGPLLLPLLGLCALVAFVDPSNLPSLLSLAIGAGVVVYSYFAYRIGERTQRWLRVRLVTVTLFATLAIGMLIFFTIADAGQTSSHMTAFLLLFLVATGSSMLGDPRPAFVCVALSLLGATLWVALLETGLLPGENAAAVASQTDAATHLSRLGLLAIGGSLAILGAQRIAQLRIGSFSDGLTGLLNRNAFEVSLARSSARARARKERLSVAMIDLDHFKEINDEHGHRAGDEVLRWVAEQLRASVRSTDIVCRLGGDEFAVAFLGSDHHRLDERLEEFRRKVEDCHLRSESGASETLPISVSIGIARVPSEAEDLDAALSAADKWLYTAKSQGRNCLVSAVNTPAD